MQCHIGVDVGTSYVNTITATSANVHDITEAHNLLRKNDKVVYDDSGYIGIEKREEIKNDENLSKIDFRITRRPSILPKVSDNSMDWEKYIDYRKSSVRSKVEHAFHIIKNRLGFNKVHYLGIAKNLHKLNIKNSLHIHSYYFLLNNPFFTYGSVCTDNTLYPVSSIVFFKASSFNGFSAIISVNPLLCEEVTLLMSKFLRIMSFT